MSAICSNCQRENPDDAKFCLSCGKSLKGEAEPAPSDATLVSAPASALVKTPAAAAEKPPSKANGAKPAGVRVSWRCFGTGCLLVLLVLLIGLPLLHLTVIRPLLQTELTKQLIQIADGAFETQEMSGTILRTDKMTQAEVNEQAQAFWKRTPGTSGGNVTLKQDLIVVEVTVFGLPLQAQADLRPDAQGNLLVKSFSMNWVMQLFFTPEGLQSALADYINQEILTPNQQAMRAFQVTDGGLLVVYEKR